MNASFETRDGYILVIVNGEYSLKDASRLLEDFAETYQDSPIRQILCDIRLVTGSDIQQGIFQRFELAALIAKLLSKRYKLALWMTEKQIDRRRLGENVMVNRGLTVKVTTDLNEALQWLGLGPSAGENQ
jgi:hypothetical protein